MPLVITTPSADQRMTASFHTTVAEVAVDMDVVRLCSSHTYFRGQIVTEQNRLSYQLYELVDLLGKPGCDTSGIPAI